MEKSHESYILDILEDEYDRLKEELTNVIPVENIYSFNRMIELLIEIEIINNRIAI